MAAPRKILICEDEDAIREFEVINLQRSGYEVVDVSCGEDAIRVFDEQGDSFSVAILDIMMPGIDGFAVCKHIREKNNTLGIIMLSAKGEIFDKVLGLEMGADDYISKPFGIRELLARVKALLRRSSLEKIESEPEDKITAGDLIINNTSREVYMEGKPVFLSLKEFELLYLLASHRNRVFTREQLLELIWGYEYSGETRTVDVHVRNLRKKIEKDPDHPQYIQTVRGMGYKFV